MEIFQWKTPEEAESLKSDPKALQDIRDELADIVIYSLSMANALNIDVSGAVLQKLEKNRKRYPVGKAKGSSKKYTQL
jgi:NTP pyrophosphatase (non-canonical NTP hydrolase)